MASYRGHLAFSTSLGIAYGAGAYWSLDLGLGMALAGGCLTAISGMLPDLDSDSGKPVRLLFGVLGVLVPLLLIPRLVRMQLPVVEVIAAIVGLYLLIRYVAAGLFKRVTVHRGMFHSIPAMLISGLFVFLLYHNPNTFLRYYLAGGVMLGFFSHLLLDELCSVDMSGLQIKLNNFAGSALKFFSPSWGANLACYALLVGLTYLTALQFDGPRQQLRQWQQQTMRIASGNPR